MWLSSHCQQGKVWCLGGGHCRSERLLWEGNRHRSRSKPFYGDLKQAKADPLDGNGLVFVFDRIGTLTELYGWKWMVDESGWKMSLRDGQRCPSEMERSARMTWIGFFSSLGGLFGLCLGFSIISFIEVKRVIVILLVDLGQLTSDQVPQLALGNLTRSSPKLWNLTQHQKKSLILVVIFPQVIYWAVVKTSRNVFWTENSWNKDCLAQTGVFMFPYDSSVTPVSLDCYHCKCNC